MKSATALLLLATSVSVSVTDAIYQNVYGRDLEPCSSDGMALTGYTRSSYCTNVQDDVGSHHVCVDVGTTSGGNFCAVTGQPDWCSSSMPCHPSGAAGECPVRDWCVCQWAFASYIEKAGGCGMIQDIKCESINVEAVKAYERSEEAKHKAALECIRERCGLE
uniref:Uncharacterized protein n=1 Tax=Trieres chinensis TaxID=1514140 RepID=A0A7S2EKG7_TRICV|mmetsp:Transcript_26781/g.54816  ORF Transcript_26781/g.54816 Transcript_26781/m.54816 type:complete len:163 (+) Transcript_26781:160-648(+)|eukprot:CAMPEP_0183308546 /NCGR_PEP_ID=MMETSP0160_2-20130417/22324_1 /TAXON_ID=2839 ORGANISM="Odontella Sinensis, Strain Grunow 1884" /NCGR_SAMPLE_ID=MMETSP0160_2 /ASSEMBLY_ACC=CAM_ASM_000250 /LENGTH=162 /DNA_ID=CAMNT_0025472405 /DNA_START=129 /DNA_END=617 /DNA_ORIENTATION=-